MRYGGGKIVWVWLGGGDWPGYKLMPEEFMLNVNELAVSIKPCYKMPCFAR